MAINNIFLLSQLDYLICSSEKENQIEMTSIYHLKILQWEFQLGTFDENLIENFDNIHLP